MFSFLRQTFCQWARTGTRSGAQPPAVRHLECEALEDRMLLSLSGAQLFANSLPSAAQAVVADAPDGRAVVAWTVEITPINHNIHAQRFDAAGHKTGPEILVAGGREDQYHPAVAMNANGDFVVAWVLTFFQSDTDIHASVFHADGSRVADDVPVAWSYKAEFNPSVGMDARGDFVVSYTFQFGPGDTDVKAILFNANATAHNTIDVAVGAADSEDHSHVLMNPDGNFAVSYLLNGVPQLRQFSSDLLPGDPDGTPPHTLPPPQKPILAGILSGGYFVSRQNPETGKQFDLGGIGEVAGLGEVFLTGELRSTGFLSSGHASGHVTLQGRRGTVTLDLEGPRQRAFAHLPQQFQFTVEAGTGAYSHLHARGIATLDLFGAFHTFTLDLKRAAT